MVSRDLTSLLADLFPAGACKTVCGAIVWDMVDRYGSENRHWQDTTIAAQDLSDKPETAEVVQTIELLRSSIDNIDSAIVTMLAERFKCTNQIGQFKAQAGFAPQDPSREDEQVERMRSLANKAGLDPYMAEQYMQWVTTESKNNHLRIAQHGQKRHQS